VATTFVSPVDMIHQEQKAIAVTPSSQRSARHYRAPASIVHLRGHRCCRDDYAVWQARYFGFNVLTERKLREKLCYMHMNPVEEGLVDDPCDWAWSWSAVVFAR
jgi:hypothetical protein